MQVNARSRLDSPSATRWLLVVGVVAVSFAGVLIRVASAPALALAFWRSFGGALALTPAALRDTSVPTAQERRRMLLSGVCLAVHFALFIGAFAFASIATVVVLVATSPVWVGIGSWLFLGTPPSPRTWIGIAVAAVGAVVVGLAEAGGDVGSDPLLGALMAVGGAIAVSAYLIIGQRTRARLSVATYGAWVYGTAAAVLLLLSVTSGSPLFGFDATTWWAIAGLTIGPQLLGHTVFNLILDRVPATTVAVVVLSEPVGAGLLALLLLAEVPPPLMVPGGVLILLGVYLASDRRPNAAVRRRPAGR